MSAEILIVDDEEDIRSLIAGILQDEGYETRVAGDSESALREIEARRPSLLLQDIWLQGSKRDGLEVLRIVKSRYKDLPVIMISGHGNIETAVAAIKLGAYDFIEKPFQTDKLIHLIARATEAERLRRENADLRKRSGHVDEIIGQSTSIHNLRQAIEKIAPTNSRVMICGPNGVGKEIVARQLHKKSLKAKGNFIVVNCASIEPDRMEHELFGIEQNGSVVKTGVLEQAHGGTLYLDEVGDMPLTTQAKILRVLTEQFFQRVGGTKKVQVDVRVVSSTAQDLKKAVEDGRFREDLFHRLNVVPISVPPLSDRRDDIPILVEHFLGQLSAGLGRAHREVSLDAMASLQSASWPGNVRQLRNTIERLIILGGDAGSERSHEEIKAKDIQSADPSSGGEGAENMTSSFSGVIISAPLREARQEFEREYLRAQIMRFNGNISRTATFIGMERSALHRKLKSLGITTAAGRKGDT